MYHRECMGHREGCDARNSQLSQGYVMLSEAALCRWGVLSYRRTLTLTLTLISPPNSAMQF